MPPRKQSKKLSPVKKSTSPLLLKPVLDVQNDGTINFTINIPKKSFSEASTPVLTPYSPDSNEINEMSPLILNPLTPHDSKNENKKRSVEITADLEPLIKKIKCTNLIEANVKCLDGEVIIFPLDKNARIFDLKLELFNCLISKKDKDKENYDKKIEFSSLQIYNMPFSEISTQTLQYWNGAIGILQEDTIYLSDIYNLWFSFVY
jgi:hypothetical protein